MYASDIVNRRNGHGKHETAATKMVLGNFNGSPEQAGLGNEIEAGTAGFVQMRTDGTVQNQKSGGGAPKRHRF
jgi:hypothetical protein